MATRIVMYDWRLYAPGHLVHNRAVAWTAATKAGTISAAPRNKRPNKSKSALAKDGPPGYLKRSIRGVTRRQGLRKIGATISSDASYASYVAGGTGTIISPSMFLPFNPQHPGPDRRMSKDKMGSFRDVVSGQVANNFFERGLDIAGRRYPALRG
jgi:hypothetical protein